MRARRSISPTYSSWTDQDHVDLATSLEVTQAALFAYDSNDVGASVSTVWAFSGHGTGEIGFKGASQGTRRLPMWHSACQLDRIVGSPLAIGTF